MEAGLSWNLRVSRSKLTELDMQTLTRESQELMLGLTVARFVVVAVVDSLRVILSTDIPHSGQLNITTSTLSTPT